MAGLSGEARALIVACMDDPVLFAQRILGVEPTPQQRELLLALTREGAHVAVRSGHGTGKSKALAIAALWFLLTFPDALVPCTAPTAHQLDDILWREIRLCVGGMSDWWRERLAVSSDKVTLAGSSGMIVARTARPEKPDALQGFHARHILFIIDEAAGVPDAVFEVARGALSTPGAKVVMTGNPTRLNGYFHAAFHSARDTWARLQFSCLDSPLASPEYIREIAGEYGEDSDMYRIRVLGDFPRHGMLSIIPADRVEAALAASLPRNALGNAPAILGVDPAWEGSDRSVVFLRKSVYAKVLFVGRGVNGERLAALVAQFQDEHNAQATFIDKTGVGASVCDFMDSIGRPFTGISFANTPLDPARFMNRRAELWWRMREWFQEDVCLAPHQDVRDDLIGPEYGIRDSGKIYLESKETMRKRGLASPDLGDALALTFAAPVRSRDIIMNRLELAFARNSGETDDTYDPLA
jgi:hypothetical protein